MKIEIEIPDGNYCENCPCLELGTYHCYCQLYFARLDWVDDHCVWKCKKCIEAHEPKIDNV